MNENGVRLFDPPKLTGKYLTAVLKRGWLTSGPACSEFKKKLAEFLKVSSNRICLASSATAGFQAILDHLLWSRHPKCHSVCRPRVQVTDSTWPGIHQAIRHAFCIRCPDEFERAPEVLVLTSIGGAALIDDTTPGKPVDDTMVWIHDACHSWMLEWWADWSFMSLYPTKLVPGAEGGVVVAPTEADAEELNQWLYCGLAPGAAGQGKTPTVPGRKANMTDVQAALGMEALELAPGYIAGIQESWGAYAEMASVLQIPYRGQPNRAYLFQIEVPGSKVVEVRKELERWGVPSAWNFSPSGLVTIPLYPNMSRAVQVMIMDKVERALTECDLRGPISKRPALRRK